MGDDNNKIAGYILHQDFFDNMHIFLENMAASRLEYLAAMSGAVKLMNTALTTDKTLIANHETSQELLLKAHHNLMTVTDVQLAYLSHLEKIVEYMPQVVECFGNDFRYALPAEQQVVPKGEWKKDVFCYQDFTAATEIIKHNNNMTAQFIEFDLSTFCNVGTIRQATAQIIQNSYTNINFLRVLMSPKTLQKASEQDAFSLHTLEGRLSEVKDIPLRIECCYYLFHNTRLGLYPKATPVNLIEAMDKDSNPTNFIMSITPESAKIIKHAPPQPSKPRLIHQSPR